MLVCFLTTKQFIDSCIRRNDVGSDDQRPPLADEAQRNSRISLLVVNIRTSTLIFVFFKLSVFILIFVSNKFKENGNHRIERKNSFSHR